MNKILATTSITNIERSNFKNESRNQLAIYRKKEKERDQIEIDKIFNNKISHTFM